MSNLLNILIQCGNEFDECFTIVDLQKEDSPLIYINQMFTQITGFGKAESLGRNCRFLQGPNSDHFTAKELRKAISHGKICWFDLLNYKKSGEEFWNRLILIPILDEFEETRFYIGIQCDVTALKNIKNYKPHQCLDLENQVTIPLNEIFIKLRSMQYLVEDNNLLQEIKQKIKQIVTFVRQI